jgi:hypothetical protein
MPYGILRGLGELVPLTIPLVGLAKPVYFAMALSTDVLRPLLWASWFCLEVDGPF